MSTSYDGKLLKVENSDRKLRKRGLPEDFSFSVFSIPPCYANELEGYAGQLYVDFRTHGLAIIDFESKRVCDAALGQFARDVAEILAPGYGIGYKRPFDRGPTYFAMGIVKGWGPVDFESMQAGHWWRAVSTGFVEAGFLRDIYPWNALNAAHLDRTVGGGSLRDYIKTPQHGLLRPWIAGLWEWEVENNYVEQMRGELLAANIIFEYSRMLEPLLHEYYGALQKNEISQVDVAKEARRRLGLGLPASGQTPEVPGVRSGEGVLSDVVQSLGVSSEDVRILKVEKAGRLEEVSTENLESLQRRSQKESQ
ncbi:MAG: hypothetical protein U0793_16845 [Gemmataceae bacterium]